MVVENDSVQVFSDYDARRHSVVYDASQCKEPVSSIPERVTAVLGLNPTPHNDPPSSIVVTLQKSRTSLQDNGD